MISTNLEIGSNYIFFCRFMVSCDVECAEILEGKGRFMKLSMHMIANRIYFLDMEVHLRESDPPVLKSARLVYATDCAYIYADENDTICSAESGSIRLKDVRLAEGFDIIQSVFDFYDDWYQNIQGLITQRAYQDLVDACFRVFHNPMTLFDTDCKVLGMSSQYGEDDGDREWAYLSRYGYSSIQALEYMRSFYPEHDFEYEKVLPFKFQGTILNCQGITGALIFQNEFFLRINVIEKDRALNQGDYQMLEMLLQMMHHYLDNERGEKNRNAENSVFYSLLNNEMTDSEKLNRKLMYAGWSAEDRYQVVIVRTRRKELSAKAAEVMRSTLMGIFPECRMIGREKEFILIWNISKSGAFKRERVQQIFLQTDADVGISLPMEGIFHLSYLYTQAKAAVDNKDLLGESSDKILDFYYMGINYILMSGSLEHMMYACHPDVRSLWKREQEEQDGLFDTFSAYLKYERSVLNTSQAVYIHRNTLLYRIKKIKELLKYDLEDAYTRNYMQVSVMVTELYRKMNHGLPERK